MQVSNKNQKDLLWLRFIYRKINLHLTIMRSQLSVPIRRQNPKFPGAQRNNTLNRLKYPRAPRHSERETRVGKLTGDNFETREIFFVQT